MFFFFFFWGDFVGKSFCLLFGKWLCLLLWCFLFERPKIGLLEEFSFCGFTVWMVLGGWVPRTAKQQPKALKLGNKMHARHKDKHQKTPRKTRTFQAGEAHGENPGFTHVKQKY